jgi:hypothetical protein
MQAEAHEPIRQIIDKSLVGATSLQEEQTLRQHLLTCAQCQEYLDASHRAIAGLAGFSFEVNPDLHGRVLASLSLRARQLEGIGTKQSTMWWSYVAALMLTVVGSLAASRFGGLAVAVFHLQPAPLHFGVLALWVVPSLLFCLLFPLLHRLGPGWMNEKGLFQ